VWAAAAVLAPSGAKNIPANIEVVPSLRGHAAYVGAWVPAALFDVLDSGVVVNRDGVETPLYGNVTLTQAHWVSYRQLYRDGI
jgi:hypothetical protein